MRQETTERAKSEYEILGELSKRLGTMLRDHYRGRRPDSIQTEQDADIININDGLKNAYEEVAKRGYGRVIFADEYDEDGNFVGSAYYRLSQANASFADKPIRLVARNSPVGSQIASCAIGDEIKYFANFRSLENLKDHGLREEDFADFDAASMIGFVLSPSLVAYLKRTVDDLDIGAMKIQDFSEFMNSERTSRRIFSGKPYKRAAVECHPDQKSMRWLKILDIVGALVVADGFKEITATKLSKPAVPGAERITDARWEQLAEIFWQQGPLPARINTLRRGLEQPQGIDTRHFVLRRLAAEIDRRVRLADNEIIDLEPNEKRMLDRNMRQDLPLANLSAAIRSLSVADERLERKSCEAPLDIFKKAQEFAERVTDQIIALPEAASVAVICANDQEVRYWFDLMFDDLNGGFRNPMISDHSKLTTRFVTHFTTPAEAKGLEFDAVIVPDISAFDFNDPVGLNAFYVAVSRPRHAIILGCNEKLANVSVISQLLRDRDLVPLSDGYNP